MEWTIFQTIVYIVGFLAVVVKISNVIQKNTDAINTLSEKLDDLTTENKKDHDIFNKQLNHLNTDVASMKVKHESDIELLKTQHERD